MQVVSLCSYRKYPSFDMQHDLIGSPNDLDLRSNLELDLLRSKSVAFDASQSDKHAGAITDSLSFLDQKLFIKKRISPKTAILKFLTSGALTLT